MESCLNITKISYKDIEEYKIDINDVIKSMLSKKERLVFAVVAEKSGITRFVIRRYPELRNYILQTMMHYKEEHVINQKIDKAVNNLLKSNKSLSFISILNKCNFSQDIVYQNKYIKNKIISALTNNFKGNTIKKEN